jgi:hypothetical protein
MRAQPMTLAALFLSLSSASAQEALGFRDEFTGDSLAPQFRVLNPDPNRMALVDGEYVLLLAHEDEKNVLTYVGELPDRYEIVVRFANVPEYNYQYANVYMSERDNGIASGVYLGAFCGPCPTDPVFFFRKDLNGEFSNIDHKITMDDLKPFYLKISKDGVEYTSHFSYDGSHWTVIGTHVSVRPYQQPRVAVGVYGGTAPESPIRVDFFEIIDLSAR